MAWQNIPGIVLFRNPPNPHKEKSDNEETSEDEDEILDIRDLLTEQQFNKDNKLFTKRLYNPNFMFDEHEVMTNLLQHPIFKRIKNQLETRKDDLEEQIEESRKENKKKYLQNARQAGFNDDDDEVEADPDDYDDDTTRMDVEDKEECEDLLDTFFNHVAERDNRDNLKNTWYTREHEHDDDTENEEDYVPNQKISKSKQRRHGMKRRSSNKRKRKKTPKNTNSNTNDDDDVEIVHDGETSRGEEEDEEQEKQDKNIKKKKNTRRRPKKLQKLFSGKKKSRK